MIAINLHGDHVAYSIKCITEIRWNESHNYSIFQLNSVGQILEDFYLDFASDATALHRMWCHKTTICTFKLESTNRVSRITWGSPIHRIHCMCSNFTYNMWPRKRWSPFQTPFVARCCIFCINKVSMKSRSIIVVFLLSIALARSLSPTSHMLCVFGRFAKV